MSFILLVTSRKYSHKYESLVCKLFTNLCPPHKILQLCENTCSLFHHKFSCAFTTQTLCSGTTQFHSFVYYTYMYAFFCVSSTCSTMRCTHYVFPSLHLCCLKIKPWNNKILTFVNLRCIHLVYQNNFTQTSWREKTKPSRNPLASCL